LTKNVLADTLDEICQLEAPLWRRLQLFVAKQREWKTPFLPAGERLIERLRGGDFGHSAPKIGETMPDFVLPDQNGRMRGLDELVSHGPVIVSLNRGHWCPFCRIELSALADAHRDFDALGAKIVSIMPDRQQFVGRLPADIRRKLTILSDIDNELVLSLDLAVWLGDELRELMRDQGLDLGQIHGNQSWCVPVPATFVLDGSARVVARRIEPDFRERMSIEEISSALQSLRAKQSDGRAARDGR
jgi:peroxiredoxin